MEKLNVERCPETGICSIIKNDGTKVDLMPGEADTLRQAAGKPDAIREILAEVDPDFAKKLDAKELEQLATEMS